MTEPVAAVQTCPECRHNKRFFYHRPDSGDKEPRCWHEDADGYCGCHCEFPAPQGDPRDEVESKERIVTEHAKSYKKHLFERLQSIDDITGYLEAALEEKDHAVLRLAVKDVIEARDTPPTPVATSERAQRAARQIKKYVDESNGDTIAVRVIERMIKDNLEVK